MNKIKERIDKVQENIKAACDRVRRDPADVKLVIVTKSAEFEGIQQVIESGYNELGENRVQQLKKVSAQVDEYLLSNKGRGKLPEKVNWHMIGHLQRNKVRQLMGLTCFIHSVDTLRLAEEINSMASKMGIKQKVLLQVNTSKELQKYGVPVGAAIHLAEQMMTLANIKLAGLMTMAPLTREKDVIRDCFVRTKELFVEMQGEKAVGPDFTEISMGMSADYEIAVEEGATILRIGSAIFS